MTPPAWAAEAARRLRPFIAAAVARGMDGVIDAAQGAVTNAGGAASLPLSLPVDTFGTVAMTVRAASAVMNAYGYETSTETGATRLRLSLAVAAGARTFTVPGEGAMLVEQLARPLVGPAVSRALRDAVATAVCSRIGCELAMWRTARALPVARAALAAAANAAVVRLVAGRVQAEYREGLLAVQGALDAR